MKTKQQNNAYNQKKSRIIFLIFISQTKQFYIDYCDEKYLRKTYSFHFTEKHPKTKTIFKEIKKYNQPRPCCFILEKAQCKKIEAYRFVIVWTKIFIESGFKNIDIGSIQNYALNLFEENQNIYNERKSIKIYQLINCTNCALPKYKNILCPNNPYQKE